MPSKCESRVSFWTGVDAGPRAWRPGPGDPPHKTKLEQDALFGVGGEVVGAELDSGLIGPKDGHSRTEGVGHGHGDVRACGVAGGGGPDGGAGGAGGERVAGDAAGCRGEGRVDAAGGKTRGVGDKR